MSPEPKYDEVGYWSEIKLEIVKKYAAAYSKIMASQRNPEHYHIYIDAFAGSGVHVSKATKEFVQGSPLNALLIEPPFREYHFIDLDSAKVQSLRERTEGHRNVHIYEGDCNKLLLNGILQKARYEDYRRALCLLDPYGLHLKWEVILTAGAMKSVEIFLNFPVEDINRNVLWNKPEEVSDLQKAGLTTFWGDDSWRQAAYVEQPTLFGPVEQKVTNEKVAEAFRRRLQEVAGFDYVPRPVPMKNSQNAVVYFLFFASPKAVARDIVEDIFTKYRKKGLV